MTEANSSPEIIASKRRLKVHISDIMLSTDGELPTDWPSFSSDDEKRERILTNNFVPSDVDNSSFMAAVEQAVPLDTSTPGELPQVHY